MTPDILQMARTRTNLRKGPESIRVLEGDKEMTAVTSPSEGR